MAKQGRDEDSCHDADWLLNRESEYSPKRGEKQSIYLVLAQAEQNRKRRLK